MAVSTARLVGGASFAPMSCSIFSAPYTAWSALVARLDFFLAPLVFLGVRLGVLHHPLDLVLAEAARRRDGDLLFLARAEILRRTR